LNPYLRSRPCLRQALLATLLSACLGSALAQSTAQPPPPPTEPQQIEQLVRERKYADALKRADDWLVKNPRNAQVRFLRAIALTETGKAADAQAALEAMTAEELSALAKQYFPATRVSRVTVLPVAKPAAKPVQ
jgi:predicted Zn-dependent protease